MKNHLEFLIVVTGYNCQRYVEKCMLSVLSQTYPNFKAVFVSDGSTDGTEKELQKHRSRNIEFMIKSKNEGAAKGRWEAIKEYAKKDETVIVLVGMDDQLRPHALHRIAQEYYVRKWMTYGNWVNQNGRGLPKDFQLHFDDATHANRDYRKVLYRSTAPNTFKRFLFDQIPESDFKIGGRWINSATEGELMFSCLEMCGRDRIGVIEQPIYMYNEGLPTGSLRRYGAKYKYNIMDIIRARPKKDLLIR